jgi:flagellar biosynthesis/type III secretory pathway protein FliH
MLNTLELKELERAAWCANDRATLHAIEVVELAAASNEAEEVSAASDRSYDDGRESGYDAGLDDGREAALGAAERLADRHVFALTDAEAALDRATERLALLVQAINERQPAKNIWYAVEAVRIPINSAKVRVSAVADELEDFRNSFEDAERNLKGLD